MYSQSKWSSTSSTLRATNANPPASLIVSINCCCSGVGLLPGLLPGLFTSMARKRPVDGMQPIMSETPRVWLGI